MKYLAITILALTLILGACSNPYNSPSETNATLNTQTEQDKISNQFVLKEEVSSDIDNDGKIESIKLFTLYNKDDNSYKVKLEINNKSEVYDFKSPTPFDSVEKIQFFNLGNKKKGILIKLFDSYYSNSYSKENSPNTFDDYGLILASSQNDKIINLLDVNESNYPLKGRYSIKYLGGFNVQVIDKVTGFEAKYEIYYSEPYEDKYKQGLAMIDNLNIPLAMDNKHYFDIQAIDTNLDGTDEFVLSKVIPGVYSKDILGVIDYHYSYKNNKYVLTKQVISYNKVLGLPSIKEVNFE